MSSHQGQSILFDLCSATALRVEHRLRVFENTVVRKLLAPKADEVTGEWRRLHNEEHYMYDVYSSPNIIREIKSRRMRWVGNAARMGRIQVHTGFWWGPR